MAIEIQDGKAQRMTRNRERSAKTIFSNMVSQVKQGRGQFRDLEERKHAWEIKIVRCQVVIAGLKEKLGIHSP